ncbi:MAG: Rieske 2Fe-2S domain-containing protein [Paraburkholderia sp.]|jgi:nitrite reductase/ring-hydroxylating ferredoxin subunit|nr:Rieske 2Fe-2S domain-containing protein [Paraburkholderia sp.]
MEHKVGRLDALTDSSPLALNVDGRPLGVCKVGDKVYAFRNMCPHRRAPLACGTVEGTMVPVSRAGEFKYAMEGQVLRCPWHGWEFSIETGESLFGVSDTRVRTYPVVVRDGDVYVDL